MRPGRVARGDAVRRKLASRSLLLRRAAEPLHHHCSSAPASSPTPDCCTGIPPRANCGKVRHKSGYTPDPARRQQCAQINCVSIARLLKRWKLNRKYVLETFGALETRTVFLRAGRAVVQWHAGGSGVGSRAGGQGCFRRLPTGAQDASARLRLSSGAVERAQNSGFLEAI